MPDGGETVTVKLLASLDEVSAADWDACAGPRTRSPHTFPKTLEDLSVARCRTGWLPVHGDRGLSGGLTGAAPCYLKTILRRIRPTGAGPRHEARRSVLPCLSRCCSPSGPVAGPGRRACPHLPNAGRLLESQHKVHRCTSPSPRKTNVKSCRDGPAAAPGPVPLAQPGLRDQEPRLQPCNAR